MLRWKDPNGTHETVPTIGTDLACQSWDLNGVAYRIQLWDTAGQEAYHSITAPYFRACHGVFLVFDLTNKSSFEALPYWLGLIQKNCSHMPLIVLIANKNDLPGHQIDGEAIATFCRERDLTYFVTSALTGENVQNAANHMLMTLATGCRRKVDQEPIRLDRPVEDRQRCC
jgi:small GTP-binding protein